MADETVIELIRHGEPEGGSRYRGHGIDDPLSERGWNQMWEGIGDADHWDMILSSPLVRCADFAHRLGKDRGIPVRVVDNLKEIGFGAWEGMTKEELLEQRADEFHRFYLDPLGNPPENAESVGNFFIRISDAYNSILDEFIDNRILIVGHAGMIRAAIMHAIGAGPEQMYNLEIKNGMISRIRYRNGRIGLELINGNL